MGKPKEKELNLGGLIDKLFEVREQIRELNKQVEELAKGKDVIELQLIGELKKQGVEQSRGDRATATLTTSVVPRAVDWDKAYDFIIKHKLPYLFEKRLSATVYREIIATRKGGTIPGIESFEKQTISLRTT